MKILLGVTIGIVVWYATLVAGGLVSRLFGLDERSMEWPRDE